MTTNDVHPGGFLSPSASIITTTSSATHILPAPRSHALRSGSAKESTFIRHVDAQLLHINRRFAKRTTPLHPSLSDVDRDHADAWGDVAGYSSMREACTDIAALVHVVWVSGTPGLQVPYLIAVALLMGNVVTGMPVSPRSLFRVLGMLDVAFASLLVGRDVETGVQLPGFESGRRVSGTEKVRIRSQVERTRLVVGEAFRKGEFQDEDEILESGQETDTDRMETDSEVEGGLVLENPGSEIGHGCGDQDDDEESWDMQIARVYDRTMLELGDSLEEPSIGVLTEGRG